MTRQLMLSTQVSYNLALVGTSKTDNKDIQLSIIPLLQLTTLVFLFWQLGRFVSTVNYELAMFLVDVGQALDFTSRVFSIAFASLTFGLGVTI